MSKMMRIALFVFLSVFAAVSAFAVDDELVARYLNAANDQLSAGNAAKAFSYINIVLNSYKAEDLPQNVQVIAETIYYSYLSRIKDGRLYKDFPAVKEKLLEYPYLSSERITRLGNVINAYQTQDSALGPVPAQTASGSGALGQASSSAAPSRSSLELQLALETVRKDAAAETRQASDEYRQELLSTQKDAYETALREAKAANGISGRLLILALILVAAICFVIFVVVIINLLVNVRNSKSQNEKFVETLRAVSELARVPAPMTHLEALPNLYGSGPGVRMIGSAVKETGLPPPPSTEDEKTELNELAVKCREYGVQIDAATGRKNNSKNVAELVYKISQEMGMEQYESMLFFSVSMVYDIGFLSIDRELLVAESLTEEQKYEIRNHVKQGLAQLSFVPEKYMAVFADGVLMHHENMDGTGYPEGLSGNRIPYIARMLRVAESFNALISRRNYRDIFDKESALAELKKSPGLYDPEIVELLERLI